MSARFGSIALSECDRPDHVDVLAVRLPHGAVADPAWWAERVFSAQSLPGWVRALMGLRRLLVPLVGIDPRPGDGDPFAVRRVVGEEALISLEDRHLDFWVAIGVDDQARYLRGTTVVRLKGRRGRLYWSVVRLFHGPVFGAMLRRASRRDTRVSS
jgi:Protein of unknown function (DUF2867)